MKRLVQGAKIAVLAGLIFGALHLGSDRYRTPGVKLICGWADSPNGRWRAVLGKDVTPLLVGGDATSVWTCEKATARCQPVFSQRERTVTAFAWRPDGVLHIIHTADHPVRPLLFKAWGLPRPVVKIEETPAYRETARYANHLSGALQPVNLPVGGLRPGCPAGTLKVG